MMKKIKNESFTAALLHQYHPADIAPKILKSAQILRFSAVFAVPLGRLQIFCDTHIPIGQSR